MRLFMNVCLQIIKDQRSQLCFHHRCNKSQRKSCLFDDSSCLVIIEHNRERERTEKETKVVVRSLDSFRLFVRIYFYENFFLQIVCFIW